MSHQLDVTENDACCRSYPVPAEANTVAESFYGSNRPRRVFLQGEKFLDAYVNLSAFMFSCLLVRI